MFDGLITVKPLIQRELKNCRRNMSSAGQSLIIWLKSQVTSQADELLKESWNECTGRRSCPDRSLENDLI